MRSRPRRSPRRDQRDLHEPQWSVSRVGRPPTRPIDSNPTLRRGRARRSSAPLGLYVPTIGVSISIFSVLFLEVWYVLVGRRSSSSGELPWSRPDVQGPRRALRVEISRVTRTPGRGARVSGLRQEPPARVAGWRGARRRGVAKSRSARVPQLYPDGPFGENVWSTGAIPKVGFPTPAREVSGHVCRGGCLDRRSGGLLRALHLRDRQRDPSLEGAPGGTYTRLDEALRPREAAPVERGKATCSTEAPRGGEDGER